MRHLHADRRRNALARLVAEIPRSSSDWARRAKNCAAHLVLTDFGRDGGVVLFVISLDRVLRR